MSLITTLVAGSGPLLVTSRIQLNPPPAPMSLTLAFLTIARSADTCSGLAHGADAGGYSTSPSALGLTSTTTRRPSRRLASLGSVTQSPFSNFQPGQSMALP